MSAEWVVETSAAGGEKALWVTMAFSIALHASLLGLDYEPSVNLREGRPAIIKARVQTSSPLTEAAPRYSPVEAPQVVESSSPQNESRTGEEASRDLSGASSNAEPRMRAVGETSDVLVPSKLLAAPVPVHKPASPREQADNEVEAVSFAREPEEEAPPEHALAAVKDKVSQARASPPSAAPERAVEAALTSGNAPPRYPLIARERGYEGRVLLRVAVSGVGTVSGVEVLASSGFEALDRAARDAVKRWRFSPARRGGVTVASRVEVPVVFTLTDSEKGGG